jgi:hypothetical protein
MPELVVRPERIEAEVALRIVPHRVDVVRVVLRVVVLDEQRRPVEAVVVRTLRVDRARPREVDPLELRRVKLPELRGQPSAARAATRGTGAERIRIVELPSRPDRGPDFILYGA